MKITFFKKDKRDFTKTKKELVKITPATINQTYDYYVIFLIDNFTVI
jgi:hypothetical protein